MPSRKIALGLLLGTLATLRALPTFAQSTTTIRVGAAVPDPFAEAYFGLDEGIFSRAGLNVEITTFVTSQAIVNACVGGSIDVGVADMLQLANPVIRGVPLAFFAGGGLFSADSPINSLCVAKTGSIQTAKDLEGKTIAVPVLKSMAEASTREWLRQNGVNPESVKFIELPIATLVPALVRGTVDAASVGEPFLTGGRDSTRILAVTYDTIAKSFYICAWFAPRDWIAKNPEAANRFTHAVYDTARWSNAHHDDTARTLAKYAKVDIERVRKMNRTTWATSLEPGLMQPVLDIALKYRMVERPVHAADLIVRVP